MENHLADTGEEITQTLFRSPKVEVFELIKIYLGNGLEMAGHLVDTGEGIAWTLFRSPETEHFELFKLWF